jgi:gluconokinase
MRIAVIGVAGSGKTTVGELLAGRLGCPFLDADSLHSESSREQMGRGVPITSEQRDEWFERVIDAVASERDVVLACSALRRSHRDQLGAVDSHMFLLEVPTSELRRRLGGRPEHFFDPNLLGSQLDTFDEPSPEEDIVTIDADRPVTVVVGAILEALGVPGVE